MVRLSIVIPAVGDQNSLDDTLLSVLENRPHDCEIILPHPAGYVDPYQLADEVRFVESPAGSSLGQLLRLGCTAAEGTWVHWLLPGVRAHEGWTEPIVCGSGSDGATVGSPLLVTGQGPAARVWTLGVGYHVGGRRLQPGRGRRPDARHDRAARRVLGPSLWAGFLHSSVLRDGANWRAEAGAAWADVDLALQLAHQRRTCQVRTDVQLHLVDTGLLGQIEPAPGFHSAWRAERFYRSQPGPWRSPARHAWQLLWESVVSLGRGRTLACWAGRLWGRWVPALLPPPQAAVRSLSPQHRLDPEHAHTPAPAPRRSRPLATQQRDRASA